MRLPGSDGPGAARRSPAASGPIGQSAQAPASHRGSGGAWAPTVASPRPARRHKPQPDKPTPAMAALRPAGRRGPLELCMAPLPAPAEKPSHRTSESQSHAKVSPPAKVAVFLRRPLAESSTGVDNRSGHVPLTPRAVNRRPSGSLTQPDNRGGAADHRLEGHRLEGLSLASVFGRFR